MIFLLSPAKSLDFDTPVSGDLHPTQPLFVEQAQRLIAHMRTLTPAQIAELMDLSDKLATLNAARYQAWEPVFHAGNSRPAVLAFNGDVYEGLDAHSLSTADLLWTHDHLAILSGLYGILRPLDWMQPYRLEMGTALHMGKTRNLYQFWGTQLTQHLRDTLSTQHHHAVINLASQEYAKAVDMTALGVLVVDCVFEDYKAGRYKIISFYAKRARGLMARYAITHRLSSPEQLRGFDLEGYHWEAASSTPERLVFRRKLQD